MSQEVICVGVAYHHFVRAGCYLHVCYHIATLRCGSQSAVWHHLTNFRGDTATLRRVLLNLLMFAYSSSMQQQQSKSPKRIGGWFFKGKFWIKTDKNRIYQCDRLYYPKFLAGIMKAITLFFILHLHATQLISSEWSTKGTQIFDTPRAQTPTYAFYMQGPI